MNVWEYLKKDKIPVLFVCIAAAVMLCVGYAIGRLHHSAVITQPQTPIDMPSVQAEEGKLDLNTATKDELMSLPGVGEKTADAILDYRADVGCFFSVDELLAVEGIGEKKLQSIKPYITIGTQ